jgi:hypothetical protein
MVCSGLSDDSWLRQLQILLQSCVDVAGTHGPPAGPMPLGTAPRHGLRRMIQAATIGCLATGVVPEGRAHSILGRSGAGPMALVGKKQLTRIPFSGHEQRKLISIRQVVDDQRYL